MHSLHEEVKSLNQYVILECSRIDTSIQWHMDIQDERFGRIKSLIVVSASD